MTTIHLIDASPYIFRAFFALPRTIRDRAGDPANAVYGFASFLVKYLTDTRPTHIAVAFDQNLNASFRNETFATYKAARPPPPPELESQLATCLEAARALGVATFIDPDYEADDLIATVVHRLARGGRAFVIASVDKDLAQLVGDDVTLCDPGKSLRLDAAGVQARYGVRPGQITDWLALAGDPVDNIPGVPGIGPKTAAALLEQYDSLEGVYRNLDALRRSSLRGARSIAAKLQDHVELAALSRDVATLSREAPVEVTATALRYTGIDVPRARALFGRLGFRTLAARLVPPAKPGP